MNLSDLKKHAKKLKTEGYPISGYSKLHDTPEDISTLRKMIRKAQKSEKSSSGKSSSGNSSSVKAVSPIKKSGCNPVFDNLTHCQKRTSVKQVKELADDCGIDTNIFNTKPKQCAELIRVQGGGLKTKSSSKKSPKKKDSSSSIDETNEYKKLNKMKKKDDDGDDLLNMARKLNITYSNQDGENISIGKLRKHELILAIINKKGKSSKKKTPPVSPKKKSKKKKTPPPPPVSPKKKSKKKKTPPPPPVSPKKKSKKKKTPIETVPDKWSVEGLIREKLLNQVVLETGKSKNFYKNWSSLDLKDELKGLEIERDEQYQDNELKDRTNIIKQITSMTGENKSVYKDYSSDEVMDKLNELIYSKTLKRRAMVKEITSMTGENKSVYKDYTFDEVMDKLNEIRDLSSSKSKSSDYEDKLPKESDESSSDDDKPLLPVNKNSVPVTDDESSDDESSDDEKPSIAPAKKNSVPVVTDDESSEESDRPSEGTEVVDVESTLANVIAGNKKIGELAKVQRSVLKCMGLLS